MSRNSFHSTPSPEPDDPVFPKFRFPASLISSSTVPDFNAPRILLNPTSATPERLQKKWRQYAKRIRYVETVILGCQGRMMKVVHGVYGSTSKALSVIEDINPRHELSVLQCCNNFTTLLYEHFFYYHEQGVEVPEILFSDRERAFELSENCGDMLQRWFDRGPTFGYPYKGKARVDQEPEPDDDGDYDHDHDIDPTSPAVAVETKKVTKIAGKSSAKTLLTNPQNTTPNMTRKTYGGKQPKNGYVPTINSDDDDSDFGNSDGDGWDNDRSRNDADGEEPFWT
ncbi:hypothetical protein BZA77DRAFT_354222 [Pyronema omphalodes]|nr:hypothetical protein BZA77DRAFT_354222 [Pyronema omphalodes]